MGMKKVLKKTGKVVSAPIRVPVKKVKEHHARKKEHPEDDVPETEETVEEVKADVKEVEDDLNKVVTPGFAFGASYSFDENGNPVENNSSTVPIPENNVSNEAITDIIINNETIKELVPAITPGDISVYNGMLLLKVNRNEGVVETFRVDLADGKVMIQAPLSHPYIDIDSGIHYKFASVDVSSELGRNILINENYVIKLKDVDPINSIMRVDEKAA
jgi:hypothetical protein